MTLKELEDREKNLEKLNKLIPLIKKEIHKKIFDKLRKCRTKNCLRNKFFQSIL